MGNSLNGQSLGDDLPRVLEGVIANLNVNTEQDLITEQTLTTFYSLSPIFIDYKSWLTDASITGTGSTLTVRVYMDDVAGTLSLVDNFTDVITEGLTNSGLIQIPTLGIIKRNYKVTVQSSTAPTGGAGSNLVKYYLTYIKLS